MKNIDIQKRLQTIFYSGGNFYERKRTYFRFIESIKDILDLLKIMVIEKDEQQIAKEANMTTASHKEKDKSYRIILRI